MDMAIQENVLQYGNDSLPSILLRQRRHHSFVSVSDLDACQRTLEVMNTALNPCDFVKQTESCKYMVNIVDYLKIMLCYWKIQPDFWGIVLISFIMLLLILVYGMYLHMLSFYFIIPNILHCAQYVHISMYDYGWSTISVIMTWPQVLWVWKECHTYAQNGTLLMSHMLGKAFSVYTVGLGVICLRGQTKLPTFRFTAHTVLAWLLIIISLGLLQANFTNYQEGVIKDAYSIDIYAGSFCITTLYVAMWVYQILKKRRFDRTVHERERSRSVINMDLAAEERTGWSQLWHALNAFEHLRLPKWAIALWAPFWILAALQIPVIDKNRPMYGWCKYLACFNILIFPSKIYWLRNMQSLPPVIYFSLIAIACVGVTMVKTSTHSPPKLKGFYAVAGIIFGMSSFHMVGCEIENIFWQVFSYLYNVQPDIIMLTGIVFNYLLISVIIGVELVEQGFGDLACGIVSGIVLNQAFLMLPVAVNQNCGGIKNIVIMSANSLTCTIFLGLVCHMTLFLLFLTRFQLRLSHGIFLLTAYGVYLIFLVSSYFEFMHPYGLYHSVSPDYKRVFSKWA